MNFILALLTAVASVVITHGLYTNTIVANQFFVAFLSGGITMWLVCVILNEKKK